MMYINYVFSCREQVIDGTSDVVINKKVQTSGGEDLSQDFHEFEAESSSSSENGFDKNHVSTGKFHDTIESYCE